VDWVKRRLTFPPKKTKNECELIFELNDEMYELLKMLVRNAPDDNFIFGRHSKTSPQQIDKQFFTPKIPLFRYTMP
jgi:hypothetical protein